MTSSPAVEAGGLDVRRASATDLLAVHRIERASFPNPWPYEAFERFLEDPGFLVADDGSVVGFVVADVVANRGRPVGHVKNLAVHPDRRGEEIGTTLLSRALMVLTQAGVDSVKLEVRRSNEAARKLYEQFGFEPVHRIADYYEDGEDAVVLVSEIRQ
ncbi:MAG: ribosomal protein S18-alanine N-acetyltransferase [Halobacteriales archaeon]